MRWWRVIARHLCFLAAWLLVVVGGVLRDVPAVQLLLWIAASGVAGLMLLLEPRDPRDTP